MKLEENNTPEKSEQHGFLRVHVKDVARKLKVTQTLHGVSRKAICQYMVTLHHAGDFCRHIFSESPYPKVINEIC